MEHSADCRLEDVQVPPGDDDISRMSVITLESTSPPESIHSIDSSADDVDEYMVDADVDEAASGESDEAVMKLPELGVVQTSNVTQDTSVEANVPELSENVCVANITGEDAAGDVDQSKSLHCQTVAALENAEENSLTINNMPCFSIAETLDKCNDGMETKSETNSALESGMIL